MPKRKAVPSLETLSLETVARNMRRVLVRDNRVRHLAGSLVQELLQLMRKKNLLTYRLLCSFLLPQLKELNLTDCADLMSRPVAHAIQARCKNLTSLILCNCNQLLPDALARLLQGLPNLLKVDLSNTQCDAEVLSVVGTCCRKLCKLDISRCLRLSSVSLLNLAYDPTTRSFCCQTLEVLVLGPLRSRTNSPDVPQALVFLLLALPKLKVLVHDFLIRALTMIHNWQFGNAGVPPGFPSLEDVARSRMSTHPNEGHPRLTLALEKMHTVCDSSLPAVFGLCPRLAETSVVLTESPNMGQNVWSGCCITQLTLGCLGNRDMRELLPLLAELGAQLDSLSISGFSFEDKSTYRDLLDHCLNLQKLSIHLLPPRGNQPNFDWDVSLPTREFPRLSDFTLLHIGGNLPTRHIVLLKRSLESLLKHSPCLEKLELAFLPFSLDEVFKTVLDSLGPVLLSLRKLSLIDVQVSARTIQCLLSSENQLDCISLHSISSISEEECQGLRQKISEKGLDLDLLWESKS